MRKEGGIARQATTKTKGKGIWSMSRQSKLKLQRKLVRRFFRLFTLAAVAALLFEKQIAVLGAIWTITITGLLIVVVLSTLEAKDAGMQQRAELTTG